LQFIKDAQTRDIVELVSRANVQHRYIFVTSTCVCVERERETWDIKRYASLDIQLSAEEDVEKVP